MVVAWMAFQTLDVRTAMIRRSSLSVGAILLLAGMPEPVWGQEIMPGVSRFDWQSVEVRILPDSLTGIELIVSQGPQSKPFRAHFVPAETERWKAGYDSVLEATNTQAGDTSKALVGPTLQDDDRFRMALGRLRSGTTWSPQVRWYLEESERLGPLLVEISSSQAKELLEGLDRAVQVSGLDTSYHECGHPAGNGAVEDSVTHPQVVKATLPEYPHDFQAAGVDGEVWLRFVIKPDGNADPASIVVLWATAHEFGESARKAIVKSRFRPALEKGVPISCRIVQTIKYKSAERGP